MSAIESPGSSAEPSTLDDYPTFELSYLYDDSEHPEEVTVFAPDTAGDPATRWITVDSADAVPLEDVR